MSGGLAGIAAFRLTTEAPERLALFYAGLGFNIGVPVDIPAKEIALLGLQARGTRLPTRIGDQRVDFDYFEPPGRAYPLDATAADLRFQHLALVTDDAGAAWMRAQALGAQSISTEGPVTLPAEAGGVTAIKFRDPEGHPLEFLQFPIGANKSWRGRGVLGIDHSAISVADVAVSRAFYKTLGLIDRGATVNRGPAQDALDGLRNVAVDVVPMFAAQTSPHLELLGYRAQTGREYSASAPNDIAATRTVWAADDDVLLRDPDGHLHLLMR